MNPHLRRLRNELKEPRQRGMREKVAVDYFNLMAIIDDYERIDSHMRAMSMPAEASLEQQLDHIVRAAFHKHGRDAVAVINEIMGFTLDELKKIEKPRQVLDHIKGPYR